MLRGDQMMSDFLAVDADSQSRVRYGVRYALIRMSVRIYAVHAKVRRSNKRREAGRDIQACDLSLEAESHFKEGDPRLQSPDRFSGVTRRSLRLSSHALHVDIAFSSKLRHTL